ncbi:MAG: DNA polymerase III subunit beta [Candidatus Moraniibacteriota bacterium]
MKLLCTQENLSNALLALDRVVGKQMSLPILSNILFETQKGRLKLSATNLEIGIMVGVGAKIESEGKLAVPAKVLAQFVHNLPQGEVITLESSQGYLKLTSGGYTLNIKVLDGQDFPIIPEYKKEFPFSLPAQELKAALARLLFCVSTNESRPELSGVHIAFGERQIEVAATDSFRLGQEILPLEKPAIGYKNFREENPSLILPTATIQELMRVIGTETESLQIALEENQIFFEAENVRLVSRLINGRYPDYHQIIPEKFGLEVVLRKDDCIRALKIASGLSSFVSGEIALVLDPKKETATILSQSKEIGDNTSIFPLKASKGEEPMTFVFHPRYVMEGISALRSEEITFSANTPTTPVLLSESGEKATNYRYILMPIRKEYA